MPIAKTRVIVTTDMEVDDMNSAIHLALYLNELDVEAFVYTASQYHFQGDGKHTLAEVNPHWRTKGRRSYEEETPVQILTRRQARLHVTVLFLRAGWRAYGRTNTPRRIRIFRPMPRAFPSLLSLSLEPMWATWPSRAMCARTPQDQMP